MSPKNENPSVVNKYNRRFSEAFKRERVAAIERKDITVSQTNRLYNVSVTTIYKWIYRYSDRTKGTRVVVEMESEGKIIERLNERIAELERVIGQKQMALDISEAYVRIIGEELGIDVKKKYAPQLLSPSKKANTP